MINVPFRQSPQAQQAEGRPGPSDDDDDGDDLLLKGFTLCIDKSRLHQIREAFVGQLSYYYQGPCDDADADDCQNVDDEDMLLW